MLILASASPRRRELLLQLGLEPGRDFLVVPAGIDETRQPGEPPLDYVRRLALEKAGAIQRQHTQAVVLGADTTVVLGGEVLNKPRDAAEAERMLRALAGRTHHVSTGLAVVSPRGEWTHVETTAVTFGPVPEAELAAYIAGGDPLDKAGAYGIQGYAGRWVPRIEGDFFNVVGLPLAAAVGLLRASGYILP